MQGRHKSRWQITAVTAAAVFFAASVTVAGLATPKEREVLANTSRPEPTIREATVTAQDWTDTRTATEPAQESVIASRDWGAEDTEILLRIAMAEAEGESTEGKALVMLVVLNRVWSDGFPDTIKEVVFQKMGGSYQFSPVMDGGRYWTTTPDEDCKAALELVESGWDESMGALYFEACTGESWQSKNCEYLFTYGGHTFYK